MSRRTHTAFLLAGLAALIVLVVRTGAARLLAEARAAGWVIIPVVLLYAAVYTASSEAWRLAMHRRPPLLSAARAFAITAWAFALNYATPFMSVGGEPFKIAAAAQWLGKRGAAASALSERLLHFLAHVLFLLTGVVLAYLFLPRSAVGAATLLAAGAVLLVIAALPVALHRRGGVTWLLGVLQRLPLARRHAGRLESLRAAATEVDAQLTAFARESPRRFALALALEYAGRCLSVLEILFIARALGIPVGYGTAYLIASFLSLAVNLFFFVPFALGAREGGLYLIFALLGLPPALGLVTSLIGRLREMAWIALGFALALATRRPPQAPPTTATG